MKGLGVESEMTKKEVKGMAVRLNNHAYVHAHRLVNEGKVVLDERDEWSEHRPSAQEENEFIRLHGFDEYAKWYLGDRRKGTRADQTKVQVPVRRFRESPPLRSAFCGKQGGAI
jgi:hypothetical protein